MHELSVATNLVTLVEQQLVGRKQAVVRSVGVRIGGLVDISVEALQFGYQIACQGTPLATSTLQIESIPITARCLSCQARTEIIQQLYLCSRCHSADVEIVSGLELDLAWIEIDSATPECEPTASPETSP